MLVCLCHGISDRTIQQLVEHGCGSVMELSRRCGAGSDCGACAPDLARALRRRRVNQLARRPERLDPALAAR